MAHATELRLRLMTFKKYQELLIKYLSEIYYPGAVSDTFFALFLLFYPQALVNSQNKRMKQLEKYGGKGFFYNLCLPRFPVQTRNVSTTMGHVNPLT